MAEKSTETGLKDENPVVESATPQSQEAPSLQSGSRRLALSASVMGGLAALLAACGKYTTKFEKDIVGARGGGEGAARLPPGGGPNAQISPPPSGSPGPGEGGGGGGSGGGGSGGGGSGGGGGGGETNTPPPALCVDTSGATPKTPADLLVSSGGAPVLSLYGSVPSALLALKFKSSGTDALAVGDRVHVLSKKSNGSMILATRVVSARDLFSVPSAGYGLIFESLDLNGAQKIEILVHKAGAATVLKMELDFNASNSFKRSLNAMPVVDLSIPRRKVPAEVTMLSAFNFDLNAPSMSGTSDIGNSAPLGAMAHGGSYSAATSTATWGMNSVVAPSGNSEVIVQTIFGETVTPANNHFLEHQSVVVYARRTRTIGGNTVNAYVRYFMYIG